MGARDLSRTENPRPDRFPLRVWLKESPLAMSNVLFAMGTNCKPACLPLGLNFVNDWIRSGLIRREPRLDMK